MKYLRQFLIILAISFAGETLHHLIPMPIPASIYGILILFILLETKILPLSAVKETGKFLIEIMPVMFIPAAVGLLESWNILKGSWVSYAVITVCTTFLVMIVSGHVTQAMIRHGKRGRTAETAGSSEGEMISGTGDNPEGRENLNQESLNQKALNQKALNQKALNQKVLNEDSSKVEEKKGGQRS